ncbi:MAG: hypothetical protein U0805_22545 [Pirellulales bacterium]
MSDQAEKLRALVSAAESVVECAESAPATVVVSGGSAGVGATTVALNLAAVLVDRGERVLVVEAAEQRRDMRAVAGVRREISYGLLDVLEGKCEVGEAITAGPAGVAMVVSRGRLEASRRTEFQRDPPQAGGFLQNSQHGRRIGVQRWEQRTGSGCESSPRRSFDRRDSPTGASRSDLGASRQAFQVFISSLQSLADAFDVVVVDAGAGMSAWVQRLWSRAGLVALVTTPEDAAVLDAYATFKQGIAAEPAINVRLLVNQAQSERVASETQRRMDHSCQRFLTRALPALPALPRHLAGEFVESPAPPRVWEMPNTPFGHAALWLGKAVGEVLRVEDAGCGMQGVDRTIASASSIPHPTSC